MIALLAAQHALTEGDVKDLIHDYAVWFWVAVIFIGWAS